MKQHRNLFVDIYNMAGQDKGKYRKVRDDMYALKETWVDITRKEGKIEGRKEAKIEMILNMIKKNYDDKLIQEISDFSIQEIAEIREEHLNQ